MAIEGFQEFIDAVSALNLAKVELYVAGNRQGSDSGYRKQIPLSEKAAVTASCVFMNIKEVDTETKETVTAAQKWTEAVQRQQQAQVMLEAFNQAARVAACARRRKKQKI